MKFKIEQIPVNEAEALCRKITKDLPAYFGLPEANEHYALGVRSRINLAVMVGGSAVGLVSLETPYPSNVAIYWMGVLSAFQGKGIGQSLIRQVCAYGKLLGAKTMTVETFAPCEANESYLRTYAFYEKRGFSSLFNLKPEGYERTMVYMSCPLENSLEELILLEVGAREYGFDWPDQEVILDYALSECAEIREAIKLGEPDYRIQEEIGDLFHTALSLCIFSGYDPHETLQVIVKKFGGRMNTVKRLAQKQGLTSVKGKDTDYLMELWRQAKEIEAKESGR